VPLDLGLQNGGRWRGLPPRPLRSWLEAMVAALAPEAASLGVRLCGDRQMRGFNRDFRGRDQVTDVLSFPGAAWLEDGHLGDVVVCVPQARRQAAAQGEPIEREVRRLLLHGVLHCLGYDHETDGGEMERLERRLRRRWLR
jgi:probable rRNA maturation factor